MNESRDLRIMRATALVLLVTTLVARAAIVHYVDLNSTNPVPPFLSWSTAATNIQHAVDAAAPNDEIVVTNGIYATGGRVVGTNTLVNRVAVDKPVTIRSVNGPEETIIQGSYGEYPYNNTVRCVYLVNGAVLNGFTLTNGGTKHWPLSHIPYSDFCGGGVWCESSSASVTNCILTRNFAGLAGGAAYGGTLNNSICISNSAYTGGGASYSALYTCTLTSNSAYDDGGGVYSGTLSNCTLTGNSAWAGAGAHGGKLSNCMLAYNSARSYGGGAAIASINNSALTGNLAEDGAGATDCTLNNCTLTWNSALSRGGGASGGTLNNCVLYYNNAGFYGANYDNSSLSYCCTTPLPPIGVGSITNEPALVGTWRLSWDSTCQGAGSATYASGVDLDGEPWRDPPPMGCDEYHSGSLIGDLTLAINVASTNIAAGFAVEFEGRISGRATTARWEFGDGTVVSNRLSTLHQWKAAGDYEVLLRAYNETYAFGVTTSVWIRVVERTVHYVDLNSTNPLTPYTSWSTAATNIQDAVDVASFPGELVLVSNGIYQIGGRTINGVTSNRVVIDKPLVVQSANGPEATVISGGGGMWGILNNCIISANSASEGGGTYGCILNNSTLCGNSAYYGGGASGSTLKNSAMYRNSAEQGGGTYGGSLNNCTLTGNSAVHGGGAYGGDLTNCILYYNNAVVGPNYDNPYYGPNTINYCCTSPQPPGGLGNITNEPALSGDWRLSWCSLCRGAGSAAYATGLDLDGQLWLSPPAIGCDEYYSGSQTGQLSLTITAPWTNVAAGFSLELEGLISGRASASLWDFGDGTIVSNRLYTSHSWAVAGTYEVVLRAYNESYPAGITTVLAIQVVDAPVHYVDLSVTNPSPPYTTWSTAATNIQDAIDVGVVGALVLVTNGVYNVGGRTMDGLLTNRVVIDRPLTVRAVNGPEVTVIEGYQIPGSINGPEAIRCAWLTSGAVLSGFTLTNGASAWLWNGKYSDPRGGAVWCESSSALLTNCVVAQNRADLDGGGSYGGTLKNCTLFANSAENGGGAYGGTLKDCTLITNRATSGAGVYAGTLGNCTLTGNSGYGGGGAFGGTLNNCSLIGNRATNYGGGVYAGTLSNCTLTGNSAWTAGAAYDGTLENCTISGNSAYEGGGTYRGMLNNCTLTSNSARRWGGGTSISALEKCTLSGNSAEYGGGACDGTLNNCTLSGNFAARLGGGASWATLNNCTLTGNSARDTGGGAYGGRLNNCTLAGNSAAEGGGAYGGNLNNSIVYYNSATHGANYYTGTNTTILLYYSCTTPLPTNGWGNITDPPLFADRPAGNLRLQPDSPCINAGNNAYITNATDLDGNPRTVGDTVDIGAYEFPSPTSALSYAWLQRYGLPTDGSADYIDSDADGHNNWQEWRCWTNPKNALSALRVLSALPAGTNVAVTWQSVLGVNYFLDSSADLSPNPSFTTIATNLTGQGTSTIYSHTNAASAMRFYRVGVAN